MYTVDASVWINAFDQRENGHVDSREFLQLIKIHGLEVAVPTLMLVEVAGTISRTRGDINPAIAFAEALAVLLHVTFYDLDNTAAHQSLILVANRKLRGADAVYAALALQVGSTLVTLDKEQLNRLTGIVATVTPADAVATVMASQSKNSGRAMTQILFQYHPDLLNQYPAIAGGLLFVTGLQNGPTPPALLTQYTAEQAAVNSRLPASLADLPSIAAWRTAFRRFGVNPTQYRCAAEALLRRLSKAGDIPSINTLVDIGNLVSIRYGLPVAIFDWREVTGTVTVRTATGSERFTELGNAEPVHPEVGEVIFVDEAEMVLARRWCWRQSAESAAREDTTTVLVAIEAQHENGAADVHAASHDLQQLLATCVGGTSSSGHLNATQSAFSHP